MAVSRKVRDEYAIKPHPWQAGGGHDDDGAALCRWCGGRVSYSLHRAQTLAPAAASSVDGGQTGG